MVWLHLFSDLVWRTICVLRGSRDRACKKLCNVSRTIASSCARNCSNSRACTRSARKYGCSMGTLQTQPLSDIFTVIWWKRNCAVWRRRSSSCIRNVSCRNRPCRRWACTWASQCCCHFFSSTHVQFWSLWSSHFDLRSKLKMEDFKEVNKALKVQSFKHSLTCSILLNSERLFCLLCCR